MERRIIQTNMNHSKIVVLFSFGERDTLIFTLHRLGFDYYYAMVVIFSVYSFGLSFIKKMGKERDAVNWTLFLGGRPIAM